MAAVTKGDFSLTFVMHPFACPGCFTLGSKILGHCFSLDHKLKGRHSLWQELKDLITSLVFTPSPQGGKKKMC